MSATTENSSGGSTQTGSTSTFITALVTSLIILGVEGAIFLYFHNKQRKIYQPRTFLLPQEKQPTPLPGNPIKWLAAIWSIDPKTVLYANGLDAYVFVRLCRMFLWIFLVAMPLTWAVLMPVTAIKPNQGQTGLNMFVIGNVGITVQKRLAAHLVVCWVVTAWVFYLIFREYQHFTEARHAYLSSDAYQSQARSRTVLVTNIKKENMNEAFLREYASEFGQVERVWLVRDVKEANEVYDERQKACTKLETAEGKLIKLAVKRVAKGKATVPTSDGAAAEEGGLISALVPNKKRPSQRLGKVPCFGQKVDAIEHNIGEIQRTEKKLGELRQKPESFELASSAIIRFATQASALSFVQSPAKVKGLNKMPRYGDIAPPNLYWPNLDLNSKLLPGRVALSWALTIGLILIWAIPVTFAGGLSNLSGMCTQVSFLSWVCTLPKPVLGIIQGAAPPIAIAVLFILLPIILRIFAKLSGKPTIPLLDKSVFDRYALFLIIHGMLIVTISSSLASALPDAIKNPGQAPTTLATKLPQSSIYFLTFLITSAIGAAAGYLFQIIPVVKLYIFRFLGGATPRKIHKLERTMPAITYVQLLPNLMLLVIIGLTFSIMQPIITALCVVAFFLYLMSFKYLFTYVFEQPPELETGGQWFRKAITLVFVGLYIEELCLLGLFFLATNSDNSRSAIPQGVLMGVLIAITIAFQQYLKYRFHPNKIQIEKLAGSKEPKTNGSYQPDSAESVDDYEKVKEAHGFEPPAMWTKQPVIWIAKDQLGLAVREERKIKDAGLATSTEFATMNEKGNIEVHDDPRFLDEP